MRTDPFTRTPGVAGAAFIDMHYADSIITGFDSEESSKYVYKIVGLRGSGKSVEYSKVIEYFSNHKGWLVYTLSAAGNPTETLIAKLSRENFIDSEKHTTAVSVGAGTGGSIAVMKGETNVSYSRTSSVNDNYYSPEAALSDMVRKAGESGYRILIGVDDISKTTEMVKFLSILGAMLLDRKNKIYFVCTGLSKNIEDFADEPSLTFFKRSDTVEIKALSRYEIAAMYEKLLGTNHEVAVSMANFVCGYAYAYQVLGSLYFNKRSDDTLENLIPEFDKILSQDSYDLIWKSLTAAEKALVKIIVESPTGKVSEIKDSMDKPNNYEPLRDRLMKKHILDTKTRGYARVNLPRFKEYVLLWGE